MPQIIVTAHDGDVTMRERVNASDFESERFAANLVERLDWAVHDATEVEQSTPPEPAPRERKRPITGERKRTGERERASEQDFRPEPVGIA